MEKKWSILKTGKAEGKGTVKDVIERLSVASLVDMLSHELMQKIDAPEMARELMQRGVISTTDEQCIRRTDVQNPVDAHFMLIDSMPRKHPHWFEEFLEVLFSLEQKELCKLLDDTWYYKRLKREGQDNTDGPDHSTLTTEPPQSSSSTERGIPSTSSSNSQQIPQDRQHPESSRQQQSVCQCGQELKTMQNQLQDLKQQVETNSSKLDEILVLLKKLTHHIH